MIPMQIFRFLLLFQFIEFIYSSSFQSNVFAKSDGSILGHVSREYTDTPATLCTARYSKQQIILDAVPLQYAKHSSECSFGFKEMGTVNNCQYWSLLNRSDILSV